ncbi:hypothetical protein HUS23_03790 [Ectothiorhodospiraceae bacterium 2226]|nr:hypothetical protein HUS23_03790 [Ectothiorhodospiraceae bacterium 2226]
MHAKRSLAMAAGLMMPALVFGTGPEAFEAAAMEAVMLSGLQVQDRQRRAERGAVPALSIQGLASDPWYGYSPEQPIAVGTTALPRAYLEQLRGTEGEPLEFRRAGDCAAADADIDCYEVTYRGLGDSVTLFLDLSRADAVYAPLGFTYID